MREIYIVSLRSYARIPTDGLCATMAIEEADSEYTGNLVHGKIPNIL